MLKARPIHFTFASLTISTQSEIRSRRGVYTIRLNTLAGSTRFWDPTFGRCPDLRNISTRTSRTPQLDSEDEVRVAQVPVSPEALASNPRLPSSWAHFQGVR